MNIISDFSKTFTSADMPSTWSSFVRSGILWDDYKKDRDTLFTEYFHFEQEGNIEKTNEWFQKHAELFLKYQVGRENFQNIISDKNFYLPRTWVSEFLTWIKENHHTLTIVSSGFVPVIESWFEVNGFNRSGINIIANNFVFDSEGKIESIILPTRTPLDKYHGLESIIQKTDIIIWDSLEDIPVWFSGKTIGFSDKKDVFKIILGASGTMMSIVDSL